MNYVADCDSKWGWAKCGPGRVWANIIHHHAQTKSNIIHEPKCINIICHLLSTFLIQNPINNQN